MSKAPAKNNSYFIVLIILLAIIPLFRVNTLIDFTLVPHQVVLSLGLGVFAVLLWFNKNKSIQLPFWLTLTFKGFLLINLVALFGAINPVEGWASISRYLLAFGLLLTFVYTLQQKLISAEQFIKSFVIFGLLAAVTTLFQLLSALGSGEFFTNIYTVTGNFGHKNLLSSALMLSLPFAIIGAVYLDKSWKTVSIVLVFLLIIEIFVLRTRGAWLSTIVATIGTTVLFFSLKSRASLKATFPFKYVLIGLGLAVLLVVSLFSAKGVQESISDTTNMNTRFVFWKNSVEMIKEHPVLGVGPGNWKVNFPKYGLYPLDYNVEQGITHVQRPHNDYLWVLTEGGPIALICFLGLFVLAGSRLLKNLKAPDSKQSMAIDLALSFGLIGYLTFSLTDFPLERTSHNLVLMAMLALAYRNKGTEKMIQIPSKVLVVGLLVVTGFSLKVSADRWSGEKYSAEVAQANASRNAQKIVPAAEKAIHTFYNVDNYANPMYYYSSLGKLVLGNTNGAYDDAQLGYEIAPYNIIMLTQMGNVYKAQKNMDEAMKYYQMATAISPKYEVGRFSLAEIYLGKNDFVAAFLELREINPFSKDPRMAQHLPYTIQELVRTQAEHQKFPDMMEYFRVNPANDAEGYLRGYRDFRRRSLEAKKAEKAKEAVL